MAAFATLQRHPMRWILIAIGVLVLAALVALTVHVYALLQPARFTGLLEHELAGAGIRLDLEAPAEPRLFPRPGVGLQSFSLTRVGSRTPVLRANGATIVVPWRALLHGEAAIERIEIDAPRIDLGQLRELLAGLPHHQGPPQLPTVATGVHMTQGTLSNAGTPLLFELNVDTGELVPGRPFRMEVSARSAAGRSLQATLATVPSAVKDGMIEFNPIELRFTQQGGIAVALQGKGSWSGGESFALQLHGTLQHPSFTPPAPSAPAAAGSRTQAAAPASHVAGTSLDKITLDIEPARAGTPLSVAVGLDGDDTRANFSLQPTEFAGWWQRLLAASTEHPPGPLPFTGNAAVQKLDLGWLKATDLHIEADPDLAPASGATAAPASASSVARKTNG